MLFVDINLGDKKPRIVLYDDDKPEDVATDFAKMHSNLFSLN